MIPTEAKILTIRMMGVGSGDENRSSSPNGDGDDCPCECCHTNDDLNRKKRRKRRHCPRNRNEDRRRRSSLLSGMSSSCTTEPEPTACSSTDVSYDSSGFWRHDGRMQSRSESDSRDSDSHNTSNYAIRMSQNEGLLDAVDGNDMSMSPTSICQCSEQPRSTSHINRRGSQPISMAMPMFISRKVKMKMPCIRIPLIRSRQIFRLLQMRIVLLLFLISIILHPHVSFVEGSDTEHAGNNIVKGAADFDSTNASVNVTKLDMIDDNNGSKSSPSSPSIPSKNNFPTRNINGSTSYSASASASANMNTAAVEEDVRNNSNTNNDQHLLRQRRQQKNDEFLKWCQTALGIQTLLSIQEFEYIDHFHEWKIRNTHGSRYSPSKSISELASLAAEASSSSSPKTFSMRGLAATRNISEGEVVISVPYHALISLHTTIDHDPVLSRILGPEGRRKYGWTLHKTKSMNRSSRKREGKNSSNGEQDHNDNNDGDDEVMAGDVLYRLDGGTTDTFHGHGGTMSYYEIALLIVALLYHASLGRLSPLAIYIDSLLDAPVDSIPYLWTEEELEREMGIGLLNRETAEGTSNSGFRFALTSSSPSIWEVIKLVREIQKDIREMYDDVMVVLMKEHPDIFGRPPASSSKEWSFSYEKFEWAFAMVNSRHWHLPLEDLDEVMVDLKRLKEVPDPAGSHNRQRNQDMDSTTTVDAVNSMPATQPTDEYVSLHDEATKMEHIEEYIAPQAATPSPAYLKAQDDVVSKHSFMAPLADMLNFGPPCTRGQYNPSTKAFEVIATCPFLEGQEVTFWYSDDCDDVIIANYGFTHPMVPRCPTIEDWKYRSQMWKEYAETLEKTLSEAYEDLYDMLDELKGCHVRSDERGGVSRRGHKEGNNGSGNGNRNGKHHPRRKEGRTDENGKGNLSADGTMKMKDDEVDKHGRIRKVKKRPNANILEREEIDL